MNIDQDKLEKTAVTCIAYDEPNDVLFIGDERGNIIAYDFKPVISSQDTTTSTNHNIMEAIDSASVHNLLLISIRS